MYLNRYFLTSLVSTFLSLFTSKNYKQENIFTKITTSQIGTARNLRTSVCPSICPSCPLTLIDPREAIDRHFRHSGDVEQTWQATRLY